MSKRMITLIAGIVFVVTCLFPASADASSDASSLVFYETKKNITTVNVKDTVDMHKFVFKKKKAKKTLARVNEETCEIASDKKDIMTRTIDIGDNKVSFILSKDVDGGKEIVIKETNKRKGSRITSKMTSSNKDKDVTYKVSFPIKMDDYDLKGYEGGIKRSDKFTKVTTKKENSVVTKKATKRVNLKNRRVKTTFTKPEFTVKESIDSKGLKHYVIKISFNSIKKRTVTTQKNGKKRIVRRVITTTRTTTFEYIQKEVPNETPIDSDEQTEEPEPDTTGIGDADSGM